MRLKFMEFNLQDFFVKLDHPVSVDDIARLNDAEWQYLTDGDIPLKPLSKLHAMADIVRTEAPSILMLCEVGGVESLETFNTLFLAGEYTAYLVPGNTDRGIHNGFLIHRDLPFAATITSHKDWPVYFHYVHETDPEGGRVAAEVARAAGIPSRSHRKLSRDIPALRLFAVDPQSGKTALRPSVVILLVHLKSGFDPMGLDPGGGRRRGGESQALRDILSVTQASLACFTPEVPIIIAGDFNCVAARQDTSPEMQWLYDETGYEDCLEIAERPLDERITHVTYFGNAGTAHQLDYILLPDCLHDAVVKDETLVHRFKIDQSELQFPGSLRERRELPSDHYPVVCVLDL